jgi:hypothetical protein
MPPRARADSRPRTGAGSSIDGRPDRPEEGGAEAVPGDNHQHRRQDAYRGVGGAVNIQHTVAADEGTESGNGRRKRAELCAVLVQEDRRQHEGARGEQRGAHRCTRARPSSWMRDILMWTTSER